MSWLHCDCCGKFPCAIETEIRRQSEEYRRKIEEKALGRLKGMKVATQPTTTRSRLDAIRQRLTRLDDDNCTSADIQEFEEHAPDDLALLLELADAVEEESWAIRWELNGFASEKIRNVMTRLQQPEDGT